MGLDLGVLRTTALQTPSDLCSGGSSFTFSFWIYAALASLAIVWPGISRADDQSDQRRYFQFLMSENASLGGSHLVTLPASLRIVYS